MPVADRLADLGITLPPVSSPKYAYRPFKRAGDLVFLSGAVPRLPDGSFLVGQVGTDVSTEQGAAAARLCGLHLLAVAQEITGSLDDIEFLKITGMVNAAPGFGEQAQVMEGCSGLLVEVLGEQGSHARSAVGMGSLPLNVSVEVEAIIQVRPGPAESCG